MSEMNCNSDDLYEAVLRGDLSSIGRIIRNGRVDINALSVSGLSPLGAACHIGDYRTCEALLNTHNDTTEQISNPTKKLCLDRKNIGYFIVRKDLDQDDNNFEDFTPEGMENLEWDSEIKDEDQNNPVNYDESYSCLYKYYADILNQTADALKLNNSDFNNQFCMQKCDLNLLDRYGRTALHYASQSGNLKIVELLIEKGANVNECGKFDGMSSLHLSARSNHSDILGILIDSGARVDCQDVNGRTPLHYASYEGNVKCVKCLIRRGCNLNCLDNMDKTPLSLACINNQIEVIKILLKSKRCKVNMCDIEGHTPIMDAVSNSTKEAVQLLIANGAKVNNCQSHKLLHMAVSKFDDEMVQILVENGIQPNLRDDLGNTPLHLAVRGQNEEKVLNILDLLIKNGANVNALNTITGASILHNLVEFQPDQNHEFFEKILEKLNSDEKKCKIKIDQTFNGESPLRIAICQNKCQISMSLIRFGANLTSKNSNMFELINLPDLMVIIETKNMLDLAKIAIYSGLYNLNSRKDIVCNNNSNNNNFICDLEHIPTVKQWFSLVKFQPMSLMNLCRILIRKRIGHNKVHFSLGQLGLPKILREFLDLKIIEY